MINPYEMAGIMGLKSLYHPAFGISTIDMSRVFDAIRINKQIQKLK